MKKIATILLLALALPAFGEGVMKIKGQAATYLTPREVEVIADLDNQVATTITRQTFVNRTPQHVFLQYGFPTSVNASVTQFRWRVAGQWRTAKITGTVQDTSGIIDPGGEVDRQYLDYLGEAPFLFAFKDSLPADSTLVIELTFIELLQYRLGRVVYDYPLDLKTFAQQPLARFNVQLSLRSARELVSLANPSHGANATSFSDSTATLSFTQSNMPANSNFVAQYEVSQKDLGVFLLSHKPQAEDGFFIMLAEPDPNTSQQEVIDKVFTFIIDVSGSMYGPKIEQAKAAARYTINNLNAEDRFNVIKFNSSVTKFRPNPVPASFNDVQQALVFIDNISAGGGTNLQDAVLAGLGQQMSDTTANVFIFLTDGIASLDQQVVKAANTKKVRIFVFGIGNDVNKDLLTQLAANNNGLAEFLGNDEVTQRISEFYAKIRNPLLQNIRLTFTPTAVEEVYPLQLPDIYVGQQLIVLGRYAQPGLAQVALTGTSFGNQTRYDYAVAFTADSLANRFLPRMWAKSKIDALLVLMSGVHVGSNQYEEWKKEIIRLSLEYGILTRFTSFSDPGNPTFVEEESERTVAPSDFVLQQNYPNPFSLHGAFANLETRIVFYVPTSTKQQRVVIKIYDLLGRLLLVLFDQEVAPGGYEIFWNGKDLFGHDLPSGMYIYRLEAGSVTMAKRMTLLR